MIPSSGGLSGPHKDERTDMRARYLFGFLGAAIALGATLLSTACQPASCEKVCETQNGCSGATQVDDCQAACDADLKAAQEAGCEGEYKSRIDCLGSIDTCATQTFCAAQDAAYLKCLADHAAGTTTTTTTN